MTREGLTAYDVADHYDDAYFDDLAERYRKRNRFARRRIANVFSLLGDVSDRVLIDIGCGMGTFAIEAARRGARSVGVDPAPAALKAANAVLRAEGVAGAGFVRADAVRLPFPDGAAGLVLAADLTEHLDDETLRKVIEEAARVLEPAGALVVYTPSPTHIFERLRDSGALAQDPSHIGIRPAEELAAAATRAGLRIEQLRYLHSHLPVWNLVERLFARRVPSLRRRIGIVARKPS